MAGSSDERSIDATLSKNPPSHRDAELQHLRDPAVQNSVHWSSLPLAPPADAAPDDPPPALRRAGRFATLPPFDVEAEPSAEQGPFESTAQREAVGKLDRFLSELDDDKRADFVLSEPRFQSPSDTPRDA